MSPGIAASRLSSDRIEVLDARPVQCSTLPLCSDFLRSPPPPSSSPADTEARVGPRPFGPLRAVGCPTKQPELLTVEACPSRAFRPLNATIRLLSSPSSSRSSVLGLPLPSRPDSGKSALRASPSPVRTPWHIGLRRWGPAHPRSYASFRFRSVRHCTYDSIASPRGLASPLRPASSRDRCSGPTPLSPRPCVRSGLLSYADSPSVLRPCRARTKSARMLSAG